MEVHEGLGQEGLLGRLVEEGQWIVDGAEEDARKMVAMSQVMLARAEAEALEHVRMALGLTDEEFKALGATFVEGDRDERSPYVELRAYGCCLRVHLHGFDVSWFEPLGKRREWRMGATVGGLRMPYLYGELGREYVAQFVVLARKSQAEREALERAQAALFCPFSYWRLYYAEWGEPVEVQEFFGFEQTEFVTVSGERIMVRPVRADEVFVNTVDDLPVWAPVVKAEYGPVKVAPEWAWEGAQA